MARTSSSESSRASVTRLAPEALRQSHAIGAGDAHLRAGVEFQIGRDLARQLDDAEILHDHGVGAGFGDGGEGARGFGSSCSKTSVLKVT